MRVHDTAELLQRALSDVEMTPADLARSTGLPENAIANLIDGARTPSEPILRAVLVAARMRPSIAVDIYSEDIVDAAAERRLCNVRIFGDAVEGSDDERSDINLLVTLQPGASGFDAWYFAAWVEELTGFHTAVLIDSADEDDDLLREKRARSVRLRGRELSTRP